MFHQDFCKMLQNFNFLTHKIYIEHIIQDVSSIFIILFIYLEIDCSNNVK